MADGLAVAGDRLAAVRALFSPGPRISYLDSATYGLPPRPTVEALERAIRQWQAGDADWLADWDRPTDRARADFARLIGAAPSDIASIPQASVGTGLVAAQLRAGDEVVVPADEFTSTLFPLLVAGQRGAVVREVPFEALADSIRPSTRLVAFSLVQMQTGRVAALEAILEAAGRGETSVLIDATQGVPFVALEPFLERVDYLVCSAYKHLLCPRGVSFLYVRRDRWPQLEPLYANWRAADAPYERYFGGPLTLADDARRFDVSRGWLAWVGAVESLNLLAGWKAEGGVLDEVSRLAAALAERLAVPWYGSSLVCAPVADGAAASAALEAAGVRAAARGDGIRFAVHVYNTEADLERAAEAVRPYLAA